MRFKIILFLAVLSVCACRKKENYSNIYIIGHGGMGLDNITSVYHDNSFESIDLALQFPGVNGVEVDVQMDLDGELWLCHDVDLNDALGIEGVIPLLHTEFIEQQHYQTLYNEPLCKLRQLSNVLESPQVLFIDIKSHSASHQYNVNPILFKQSLDEVLSLFDCEIKLILRDAEWIASFVSDYDTFLDTDSKSVIQLNQNLYPNLFGVVAPTDAFNAQYIDQLKNQNLDVYLYEMRSPLTIRKSLEKNPTGILPDDLRRALIESR